MTPWLECLELGCLHGGSEGFASLNGYRLPAEHACGTSFWFESRARDARQSVQRVPSKGSEEGSK